MTDTDDRMERAERIRKMRQSREPDENDQGADDGGDVEGASAESVDGTAENEAEVNDEKSEETNDEQHHETNTTDAQEPADADDAERVETADRPQSDRTTGEGGDVTQRNADDVAPDDAGDKTGSDAGDGTRRDAGDEIESNGELDAASSNAVEARSPDVTAQAARTETGVTEVDASAAEIPQSPGTTAEAASAPSAPGSAGSGAIAPLGDSAGFSLDDQEIDQEAQAGDATEEESTPATARARGSVAAASEPSVRVLEFTVGDQNYCLDIECVEEIVKRDTVTRVPNTEDYVEGVVDLRGQITTILDTKQLLDVEGKGPENLLVIFAPDAFEEHGTVGWVVDEVRQVRPVMESQVRTAPSDEEYVRGVVDREEDDLIVWIRPGDAMDQAVAVADDE